VQMLI